MGVDHKGRRFCDECGRLVVKIHRIEDRKEYCGSCYQREFTVRKCACGKSTRLHRSALPPYRCRSCEAQRRRCVRCDRVVPRAGLRVEGGVVCPSCRPYYLTPQFCEACGSASRSLSRPFGDPEGLRVCERCRNKESHATCVHCRRYRAIAGRLLDEAPYCTTCGPAGATWHPCPDCGGEVPGNGYGRCRSCLNLIRLGREVALQSTLLAREDCKTWLQGFADWLHARSPHDPALASDFLKRMPFIARLDSMLDAEPQCSEAWLLRNISVSEMRRHQLFMHFLAERHGVVLSEEAKLEAAESERLAECIRHSLGKIWGPLIEDFAYKLSKGGYRTRTQRQYVSAAAALCKHTQVTGDGWKPELMSKYLAKKPGQRGNFAAFFRYCEEYCGWSAPAMPPRDRPSRDAPAVKRFQVALKKIEEAGELAALSDIERLIELAFALKSGETQGASVVQVRGVAHLELGGRRHLVPKPLRPIIDRWSGLRSAS